MLVDLYEESETVRIDRIEREEAERKRKEEERLKEERRQRYNLEVERTIELENMALDYQIAKKDEGNEDADKYIEECQPQERKAEKPGVAAKADDS